MKKLYKWLLLIVLLIMMTSFFSYQLTLKSMGASSSNAPALNKEPGTSAKIEDITEFKRLVKVNPKTLPDHQKLKKLQHIVFVDTPQIKSIRNSIGILHQELDYKLRPEAVVAMYKNKKDKSWAGFAGAPDQTGNSVREMSSRIDNIVIKIKLEPLKGDLHKAQNLLLKGTEQHDIVLLWEAHNIIHDLDYFLLNYPVTVKTGPGSIKESLNGPSHYWGATESLK